MPLTAAEQTLANMRSSMLEPAAKFNPDYYSVFLSWGHALSDLARKTGSAKNYKAAFEKYRRAAEIDPTDTAAHHSWYYALLNRSKGQRDPRREH
jgi:tetratricopeptide (TPR) repeat protein